MGRVGGIALALLSLLLLAATPSQHPRSDKHQNAAKEQQRPTATQTSNPTPTEPQVPLSAFSELQVTLGEVVRTAQNQSEAANKQATANPESWSSPSVRVQMGLLIVGSIYTVFAALQWWSIRKSIDLNREALRLQQRPWVVATRHFEIFPESGFPAGTPRWLKISFRNTGQSPALKLAAVAKCITTAPTDPFPATIDLGPESEIRVLTTVIGPGLESFPVVIQVPTGIFNAAGDGSIGLWICGVILYEDAFKSPYQTNFCLKFLPPSGPLDQLGLYNNCT